MRSLSAALVCCSVFVLACATAPANGAGTTAAKTKTSSDFITTSEIDAGTFRDAYDIVQRLRPNWFTKARASGGGALGGTQVSGSGSGMAGVQSASSGSMLVVYLDNARMGGPEALRDMSASAIQSLQYMDAATA